MPVSSPASPLDGLVALRDICPRAGSYYSAYSLACSGVFGEPVTVGRTRLYRRDIVDRALAARDARRRAADV